jgi:AcrR family transcriptional regulator
MMNTGSPRGRGRPAGRTSTREDILEVARRRFLESGYEQVTLRSVAREAGVDVALISYHFGSKHGLFGAALQLTRNPPQVLADVLAGPLETLPERLVEAVLATWDHPEHGASLRSFAAAAFRDPDVNRLFAQVAEREMIRRLADRIGGADAIPRAAAVTSQIAGIIITRYILRLEPLASMPRDELARLIVPPIRATLAGPRRRPLR